MLGTLYVSDAILSTLHVFSHFILQQINKEGIKIMPISQTQILRVEELK